MSELLIATNYIPSNPNSYVLSALIRETKELKLPKLELKSENINDYLSTSRLPPNLLDKLDKILMFIHGNTKIIGSYIAINYNNDYPIAFAINKTEFENMMEILSKRDLISIAGRSGYLDSIPENEHEVSLTASGWEYVDKLRAINPVNGNQCFVAMWFNPSMNEAWENGIRPGIEDTGYKPIRIDKVEHNDQITDKIIAEIRQSRILVADFTGQRQGVYYEAGFARALNKTVISSCRKNALKSLHFDTRQFSHIIWETPEELREKIKDRILATAPLK